MHRYVWECNHGPIPDGMHVHHKDGDKTNNNIDNLELLAASVHSKHHGKDNPWVGSEENREQLRALPSLQSSGTQVKKGVTGTQKTRHKRGESAKESLSFASNAENGLKRRGQQGLSSATRIARLRRFEPEEKTIVYDLTVEKHHCYVANGVLVSNSDMFRYVGQAVELMRNTFGAEYEEPPPPDWRL